MSLPVSARAARSAGPGDRANLHQPGRCAPDAVHGQPAPGRRALAQEAADNGLLDSSLASAIARLRGVKTAGVRLRNWLPQADAQRLSDAPGLGTVKGVRDRAMLAVLLGCAAPRWAMLEVRHIQQRDGRWVIVDLISNGRRTRSVPMPSWAKTAVDVWLQSAEISDGRVFRSLRKGGRQDVGVPIAAHDLRRTFANLAMKGGARLGQIQQSLGRASIKTIERYVGVERGLIDAPCDWLSLRLQTPEGIRELASTGMTNVPL